MQTAEMRYRTAGLTGKYFQLDGAMYNANGDQVSDAVVRLKPGASEWKQGPDEIVDLYHVIRVKAKRGDQTLEYEREVAASDFDADFEGTITKLLPRGSVFDNSAGQFQTAILTASFRPDLYAVRTDAHWRDESGEYFMGKQLANFPVHIVAELKGPYGELIYRLNSNGSRVDVTFDEIQRGDFAYKFGHAGYGVRDRIGLFMSLRKEWLARTGREKLQFVKEEHLEHIRSIEAKISQLGGE